MPITWRLHHYDVRQYYRERFPDDCSRRFYATQHSYCGAIAFRGIGFTQVSEIFVLLPEMLQNVFAD